MNDEGFLGVGKKISSSTRNENLDTRSLKRAALETTTLVAQNKSSHLGVSAEFIRHFMKDLSPALDTLQLKNLIVVPKTRDFRCTFVDLLQAFNPHFVGRATCFVSHAYSYLVHDTFEVMLRYAAKHPGVFFWYDPFSLNQNLENGFIVETEILMSEFENNVRNIGSTLIVSSPWEKPTFLSRAWCLFELLMSVRLQVPLEIMLPRAQEEAFIKNFTKNWSVVYEALAGIDSSCAEAREPRDKAAIHAAVEMTVTHDGLKTVATQAMRRWLLQTALSEEVRLRDKICCHDGDEDEDEGDEGDVRVCRREKLFDLLLSMSMMMRQLGELHEARRVSMDCLKLSIDLYGPIHPNTLSSLNSRAWVLQVSGDLTESGSLYRRVLECRLETLGATHPDTLTSLNNLGWWLKDIGKLAEAEVLCRRALTGRETILGPTHIDTLTTVDNLAQLMKARGKRAEAEALSRRAVDGRCKLLGSTHPDTMSSINNLATSLQAQGKFAEAEELCKDVLAGCEATLGLNHTSTLSSVNRMAQLLKAQGRLDEAEPLCRRALNGRLRTLGESHPSTLSSMSSMAQLLKAQGKLDEAEPLCRQALEGRLRTLGESHPNTLSSLSSLSALLKAQGKLEEVEKLHQGLSDRKKN